MTTPERRLRRDYGVASPQCLAAGLAALGLASILGGCENLSQAGQGTSASIPTVSEARPSFTKEVVDFVAAAPVGGAETLTDTASRQTVSVRVVSSYDAATGRPCRQYVVTEAENRTRSNLACAGEKGWVQVRPLVQGTGDALTPPTP